MWTAAVANPPTQEMFISKLATWLAETPTHRAFTDVYETQSGEYVDVLFPPCSFAFFSWHLANDFEP